MEGNDGRWMNENSSPIVNVNDGREGRKGQESGLAFC